MGAFRAGLFLIFSQPRAGATEIASLHRCGAKNIVPSAPMMNRSYGCLLLSLALIGAVACDSSEEHPDAQTTADTGPRDTGPRDMGQPPIDSGVDAGEIDSGIDA